MDKDKKIDQDYQKDFITRDIFDLAIKNVREKNK